MIEPARASGVPFAIVVADGGHGDNVAFLDGLNGHQLSCAFGVHRDFVMRRPDDLVHEAAEPLPPTKKAG